MIRLVVFTSCVAFVGAFQPPGALASGGPGDTRAVGVCTSGVTSSLRLEHDRDGIKLRFAVGGGHTRATWRVVLVHERRIAWKGTARIARPGGAFEVRRLLMDLPGTDAVSATAWGPRGLVCRAAATLPDA